MRNYISIGAVVLALSLGGSVYAQDYHWTGFGDGSSWNDPSNWDLFEVPPDYAGNTFLHTGNITIGAGEVQQPGLTTAFATLFGPDWGGTLNIYGTLNYNWYLAPVADEVLDPTSNINLFGNGFMSGEGVGIGYTWWINGAPNAALNLNDTSTVDVNWIWWGGKINIADDSTLDIQFGVNSNTEGDVNDVTRDMYLSENGRLILGYGPALGMADFNSWWSRGIISSDLGWFDFDTTTIPGSLIITPGVPEPTSLALFGLVSLLGLRRRR